MLQDALPKYQSTRYHNYSSHLEFPRVLFSLYGQVEKGNQEQGGYPMKDKPNDKVTIKINMLSINNQVPWSGDLAWINLQHF